MKVLTTRFSKLHFFFKNSNYFISYHYYYFVTTVSLRNKKYSKKRRTSSFKVTFYWLIYSSKKFQKNFNFCFGEILEMPWRMNIIYILFLWYYFETWQKTPTITRRNKNLSILMMRNLMVVEAVASRFVHHLAPQLCSWWCMFSRQCSICKLYIFFFIVSPSLSIYLDRLYHTYNSIQFLPPTA